MSDASRIWTHIDFDRTGKQSGNLHVPHSVDLSAYAMVQIPVVCIRHGDGPTALLTAGNHGDEYEGQIALRNLARDLEPAMLRGRVIIIPSLNYPAAEAGRRVSPIDEGNLNRLFPGRANGSITEMIAHYVESVLFPMADLVIDLHSGGRSLNYSHTALAQRVDDPEQDKVLRTLLQVFGAPNSVLTTGSGGGGATTLYAAASKRKIPALTTELGSGATLDPDALIIAEQGTRRVLRHYGIAPELACDPAPATRLLRSLGPRHAIYAPRAGLMEPLVEVGDSVQEGQPALRLYSLEEPLTAPLTLHFNADGVVSCRRFPTLCARGDGLFHLATPIA